MSNNAFDAPAGSVNAGAPVSPSWSEYYVQPGISVKYRMNHGAYAYGGFSYLESGTAGYDNSGAPPRWYGLPEQLYLGIHFANPFGRASSFDVSYGQQDYTSGNGMLVWSGASNGSIRGASYLGPRSAWRDAILAKLSVRDVTAQFFYLRPNAEVSSFTNTTLTGLNVVWNPPDQLRLGLQYIHASSDIQTRQGLDILEFRARWHPFAHDPHLWFQGDYATETSSLVAANTWMAQVNYHFTGMKWSPLLNVGWYDLSGANPASTTWTGFDPLYFGNDVPTWLPGVALQTLLGNTNQKIFATTLTMTPSATTSLQLNYIDAAVNQLNAVLAIPPPNTSPVAAGGIPLPGYGKELSGTFSWQPNGYITWSPFFAYVTPGNGISANYSANHGSAKAWTFAGLMFTASY
jgi:hypothetical protein